MTSSAAVPGRRPNPAGGADRGNDHVGVGVAANELSDSHAAYPRPVAWATRYRLSTVANSATTASGRERRDRTATRSHSAVPLRCREVGRGRRSRRMDVQEQILPIIACSSREGGCAPGAPPRIAADSDGPRAGTTLKRNDLRVCDARIGTRARAGVFLASGGSACAVPECGAALACAAAPALGGAGQRAAGDPDRRAYAGGQRRRRSRGVARLVGRFRYGRAAGW